MTDHAARWEQRFAGPGYMFGTAPNAFLRSQAYRLQVGGRALVPGDGEGRNGVWLAEQGMDVTTVDLAAAGVAKARALAAERRVSIAAEQADLVDWTWPRDAFDLVASIFLHLPPGARRVVHAGMADALRPGGLLLLEAFRPAQIALQHGGPAGRGSGGPPDPALLFTPAMLQDDFAGFEQLHLEEAETVLAEGTHHVGKAAVVRAVFRRSV